MPEYPKVDHSHIVPRAWLRTFADERGMIGMRLLGDPDRDESVPIKHAAVRSKAYSRTRPRSGTRIDDVEWSISQLENKAAPVLQTVEERWPLRFEEKLVLAELFGAQLVRGDRWREGYEARSDRLVDHYQRRGDFDQDATGERTVEQIARPTATGFAPTRSA